MLDALIHAKLFHEAQTFYAMITTKDLADPYSRETIEKQQNFIQALRIQKDSDDYARMIAPHATLFGAFLYKKLKNICTQKIDTIYAADAIIMILSVALRLEREEKDRESVLLYITTHYTLFEAALRTCSPAIIQQLTKSWKHIIDGYILSWDQDTRNRYKNNQSPKVTITRWTHTATKRKNTEPHTTKEKTIIAKQVHKHKTPPNPEKNTTIPLWVIFLQSFSSIWQSRYRGQIPEEWTEDDIYLYLVFCTNLSDTEKFDLYRKRNKNLPHLKTYHDRESYLLEIDTRMFMVERTNNKLWMVINDMKTSIKNQWGSKSLLRFGSNEPVNKKKAK
jgi:hypothetical protein